jgi:CheY-like chemotaxis protein
LRDARWGAHRNVAMLARPLVLRSGLVLIVDDNLDTAHALARLLKRREQDAVAVESGPKALELLDTMRPSVIVLDIMMPQMDGLEVLQYVRSAPLLKDVPVIVFSADFSIDTARRALELGAQAYLVKGTVEWKHLCDTIQALAAA